MKKILSALIIGCISLGGNITLAADQKPTGAKPTIEHKAYTAIYQAVYKSFPLQATHRLEQDGDDWFFSSIASGFFGQIEENSTFMYTPTGITPLHYVYQRSVLGQERSNELTYNQKDKVVAGNEGKNTFTLPLKGGELDLGTYILALRDDVARGIKDPCYNVIDGDTTKPFCFHVTGTEKISTALGKIDAVVVERVRKPESPRYTRFWFAPSLDYTIAKLEHQEQKGKNAYSLEITYYKQEETKK